MISIILGLFTIVFALMFSFAQSDNDRLIMKYFVILSAIVTLYSMASVGSVIGILLLFVISIFIFYLIYDMLMLVFPTIKKVVR